jgi:hypothetical protein
VTIEFWHLNIEAERKVIINKAIEAFDQDNHFVKVNQTILENEAFKAKLTTVMQSGEPPDVFNTWGGGVMNEYAKAGLLRDITEDIKKDGFADTFAPGPLAVTATKASSTGADGSGDGRFWYNKELFDKAGIEARLPPGLNCSTMCRNSRMPASPPSPWVKRINGRVTSGGSTWRYAWAARKPLMRLPRDRGRLPTSRLCKPGRSCRS